MKRFARYRDVAPRYKRLGGPKLSMEQVLDRQVLIFDFNIGPSKYVSENNSNCTKIQMAFIDTPEDRFVVFTGSVVLMHQIRAIEEHLEEGPVLATIKKEGRHYTFE